LSKLKYEKKAEAMSEENVGHPNQVLS